MVRKWATQIMHTIRRRPFVYRNSAKIFCELQDDPTTLRIIRTLHSAGLRYDISKLSLFNTVKSNELAVIIGSHYFLQCAFDYHFPPGSVAFIPNERNCQVSKLLFDTVIPHLALLKVLFSSQSQLGLFQTNIQKQDQTLSKKLFYFEGKATSMMDTRFELHGTYTSDSNVKSFHFRLNSLKIIGENGGKFKLIFQTSRGSAADFLHSTVKMALPKSRLSHLKEVVVLCSKFDLALSDIMGNFCWNFGGIKMTEQKVKRIAFKSCQQTLPIFK